MPNPFRERRDLIVPLVSSVVFVAIPVGLLVAGVTLNWIGWLSMGFGALGVIAVGAQLAGYKPPEYQPRPPRRGAPPKAKPVHHKGPLPELSANKQGQVRRMVKAMAAAGVFAPETPDPAKLYAGMVDYPYPVSPDAILFALTEANYYHPDFDPGPCLSNLAFHSMQVETPPEYIEEMIRDMERLSVGALRIEQLTVDQQIVDDDARMVRSVASMTINGDPLRIDEEHHYKYFPLSLHPAIAGRMPAERRFAGLWGDQGTWLTVLPHGAVEAMNAAMKLDPGKIETWGWLADAQPFATGDTP